MVMFVITSRLFSLAVSTYNAHAERARFTGAMSDIGGLGKEN